jgi:hypothetical protein
MADYNWPDGLPYSPLSGTLSVSGQDNEVRSPSDLGEGQVRRRASATSQMMTFSLYMTKDQVNAFEAFYKTVGGFLRFNFVDPILNETKEFRFQQRHTVTHIQGDIMKVDLSLIRKAE